MTSQLQAEAQRLVIYIGESDRWRGKPLYAAILETLKKEGMAGATVIRGVAGYGAHSRIHTAAILRLSEDLPLVIHVIDSPEKIEKAIQLVSPMVREGLITVEDVRVVRYTHRYLNPLPADRPVEEVMTQEVVTLTPQMSLADAWQKMLDTLIKAMPVVDEKGHVVGMLTDEDLLERAGVQARLAVAQKLDKETLTAEIERLRQLPLRVADVMSQPVITARKREPLGLAATRMAESGIKRLPIVDDQGKLVGIISRVDILRLLMEKPAHPLSPPPGAARTVGEVMSPVIPAVSQDAGLAEIIEKLLESGLHRLIVLDERGQAIGLISDADVVARVRPRYRKGVLAALAGQEATLPQDVCAGDLMSPGLLTMNPETSLLEAVHQMLQTKRKWLVVVDTDNHPLGLVDRHVLFRAVSGG